MLLLLIMNLSLDNTQLINKRLNVLFSSSKTLGKLVKIIFVIDCMEDE